MGVCLSRCGNNHNWDSVESKKRKTSETTTTATYKPSPYDPNHSFKMFLQAQQTKNSPSTNSLPRSSELFSLPASELHEQHRSPSDATSSRASISSKKRIQPEQPGHQRLLEAIARLERLDDKKPVHCALGIGGICSSDDIVPAVPAGKPRRNRRVRHYQLPLPKENPVQDFLRSIEGFVSLIDEPRKPESSRREPKVVSKVDDGEETFAFEFDALAGVRQDRNQKLQEPMSMQQLGSQKNAAVTEDRKSHRSNRCVSSSRVDGVIVGEETFALEFEALARRRQDRNQKGIQAPGLPQQSDVKVSGTKDCKGPSSIVACVPSSRVDDAAVGEETFSLDFKALKQRKSMSLQQLLQSAPQNNHLEPPDADCKGQAQSGRQSGAGGRVTEAKIEQEGVFASLRSRNVLARKNYKSTRASSRGRGGLKQERSSRSLDSLQSFDIHVNWEFDNKADSDLATSISPGSISPPTHKHLDEEEASPPIEVKKMESESLLVSSTPVAETPSPKDVEAPLVDEDASECKESGPPAAMKSSDKSSDDKQLLLNSERFGLLEAFQSLLKLLLFNTETDPDEENQYGIHPRE